MSDRANSLRSGNGGSEQRLCVFNLTRQSFLSLWVGVAGSSLLSLLRIRPLDPVESAWLIPCRFLFTFGFGRPVDVVYLDEHLRVLHVIEGLRPYRLAAFRRGTRSILRLPERTLFWSNTQVGDQLLICPPAELVTEWTRAKVGRVAG